MRGPSPLTQDERELIAARVSDGGLDDNAIHDAVLVAAAFCMFNRYVDGLNTVAPHDDALYDRSGKRLANEGYLA